MRVKSFEKEIDKLIDLKLWFPVDYQVSHRFGDMRFISYAKPKPGIQFWLGGKQWKVKGIRYLKEGQFVKELYCDDDGYLQHIDIKDSEYRPYGPKPGIEDDEIPF